MAQLLISILGGLVGSALVLVGMFIERRRNPPPPPPRRLLLEAFGAVYESKDGGSTWTKREAV